MSPCALTPRKLCRLDFLGSASNLVIIVDTDKEKDGPADEEERGSQGDLATLNQGDGGNWKGGKNKTGWKQNIDFQNTSHWERKMHYYYYLAINGESQAEEVFICVVSHFFV